MPTARSFFRQILLAMVLLIVCPDANAQPRDKCALERADAEQAYFEGQFDEAIRLLQACLVREELFVDEAVQVYRLMGLAAMNKGDMDQARQAIRDVLQLVPAYEGDPIQDPPSYTTLVAVVRQEVAAEALVVEEEQALAEEEQAPPEEEPEAPADSAHVVRDQPQPRADEPEVTPFIPQNQPPAQRRSVATPKTWFLATGGAMVVITAVALALGGGSSNNPR